MRYNDHRFIRRKPAWVFPSPQPTLSRWSFQAQILFICLFTIASMLYLSSIQDTKKIDIKTVNLKVDLTQHRVHVPKALPTFALKQGNFHDSGDFVSFKGGKGRELSFRKNPLFTPSTCPTTLQKKMYNDSWTSKDYCPSIHMLVNAKLLNQSEYSRLRPYYMPFGYRVKSKFSYKDIQHVLKLFPSENSIFRFPDRKQPQCLSCAVVGNGGILNGSGNGKAIDGHNMVFRVNNAIRRGHEVDVGNRTTHYFFFDRSLKNTSPSDVPHDEGMTFVFVPCRENDYKYIRNVVQHKDPKVNASTKDVRILHPDFIRYIHKRWVVSPSAFRPTTGFIMLFTALFSGCDSVSVYGMGYNDNFTLYYYDDKFRLFKMAKESHDTKNELRILRAMDDTGVINWYKRGINEFFH